jgi:hypothetical protein
MSAPHPKEPQMAAKPTSRQLNYLRALANRTGQTFTYPRTRREASREIERLKQAQPSTRIERELERKDIADAVARGQEDATRVQPGEVTGYGSTATWKDRS